MRPPGFTLLELVLVLATVVILMLVAVPSLQNWQDRQRMKAAVNALFQDLAEARSHAIMVGDRVVVCPGDTHSGCRSHNDWSLGWVVFQDVNRDQAYDATEPLLRVAAESEQIKITSTASRPSFVFYPNGTAPGSNGSVWFCDSRGPQHAQRLVISNLGRIRQEPDDGLRPDRCPEA